MAKTWKMKFKMRIGATSFRQGFTNTLYVNTDDPIAPDALGNDPMGDTALAIANALRLTLVSPVTIESCVVSDPARSGSGYDHRYMRTIPLNVNGARSTAGNSAEIKELVVRLQKKGDTGRSGRLDIRMALLDSEVNGGSTGAPSIATPLGAVDDLVTALNNLISGGTDIRVYSKSKKGVVRDSIVREFVTGGVATRDARVQRRKSKSVKSGSDAAKAAVEVAKDVLQLGAKTALLAGKINTPAFLLLSTAINALSAPATAAISAAQEYLALPGDE